MNSKMPSAEEFQDWVYEQVTIYKKKWRLQYKTLLQKETKYYGKYIKRTQRSKRRN